MNRLDLYRNGLPVTAHRDASAEEIAAGVATLGSPPSVPLGTAVEDLRSGRIGGPGLYAWWIEEKGARHLTLGLGAYVERGLLYAGQTGATKWPSGQRVSSDLKGRILRNHMRGRIRGSTFRLTLAAALMNQLGLRTAGPKILAGDGEVRINSWIEDHLTLALHPFADRERLARLEQGVLDRLDPPFNLEGRPPTPTRRGLRDRRQRF